MTEYSVEELAAHYDERVKMHDGITGIFANVRNERGQETRDFHAQTAAMLRALQARVDALEQQNADLTAERDTAIKERDEARNEWSRCLARANVNYARALDAEAASGAVAAEGWRHGYDVGFGHGKGDDAPIGQFGNGYEPIIEEFGPDALKRSGKEGRDG